jgi:acetoin utilization deacetylase AcuC-like enzyme
MLDPDTVVSPASYDVACCAAGGVIEAVKAVMAGEARAVFALVRPPGHHASRGRASGFCLFNNVAVGAAYALKRLGVPRLLILDWDVHHGNGTQDICEREPGIFFISLHEFPLYPGTGLATEKGAGNIANIPLPAGCGDAEYWHCMDEIVKPLARRFKPELLMVSAGFDGHRADPLASMQLTTRGYAEMAGRTMRLAQELCRGRLVLALEGGYNLPALAGSVKAVFDALLGKERAEEAAEPPETLPPPDITPLIKNVKAIHELPV